MLKNLKNLMLFILIAVTLLLVVVMSLAASKPVSQVGGKGISIPINPIINGKWSGLGMGLFTSSDTELFDSWVDTLLANGFTELRIDVQNYQDTVMLARSKAAVIEILSNVVAEKFYTSSGKPLCSHLLSKFSINKLLIFKYQQY